MTEHIHIEDIDAAVEVIEEEAQVHEHMAEHADDSGLENVARRRRAHARGLRTAVVILADEGVY